MKRIAACFLFALLIAPLAEAKKPYCTFRLHLEANTNDTDVFSSKLRSPTTGKPITMEKVPRLSEQDVVAFYPYPAEPEAFGVLFKLTDHGKLVLDTMSVERRGAFVYIFVNGRPVAEQQIDRRITDGKVYVPTGLNQNDLTLMAKEWRMLAQKKPK